MVRAPVGSIPAVWLPGLFIMAGNGSLRGRPGRVCKVPRYLFQIAMDWCQGINTINTGKTRGRYFSYTRRSESPSNYYSTVVYVDGTGGDHRFLVFGTEVPNYPKDALRSLVMQLSTVTSALELSSLELWSSSARRIAPPKKHFLKIVCDKS